MPSFFALLQALLVSLDHLLDHLAADGAGLTGGQVAVVAVLQINAHFLCGLHLETVHSLASLGNVDLVVVLRAHIHFSPFFVFPESQILSGWRASFLSATIALPKKEEKLVFLFGNTRRIWKMKIALFRSAFSAGSSYCRHLLCDFLTVVMGALRYTIINKEGGCEYGAV